MSNYLRFSDLSALKDSPHKEIQILFGELLTIEDEIIQYDANDYILIYDALGTLLEKNLALDDLNEISGQFCHRLYWAFFLCYTAQPYRNNILNRLGDLSGNNAHHNTVINGQEHPQLKNF